MRPEQRRIAEGILFTDQYQLSMAQLYFRHGLHEQTAQFDHFFRRNPDYGMHAAGYCVTAGLEWLLDWMEMVRFTDDDVAQLRMQRDRAGGQLFGDDFLAYLRATDGFAGLSLRAIPEGRVVHPNAPLTTVRGPLAYAQILETALLNQLNYQTLIATKAARIRDVSHAAPVLEFGLRRGQDRGANAGTRAALIGGADFTSNVGLSSTLGLAPKGTHAHALVQVFLALGYSELDAFKAYAEVYPDDCLLLVDTVDTLGSGLPNAIKVFEQLRAKGHRPVGIRLDSGDLAYLAIHAAMMLDQAGFPDTTIVLSSDLDELVIWQIQTQIGAEAAHAGADADAILKRLVYGVGTRLVTSHGEGSLGGVYKLVAMHERDEWRPAIKLADTAAKLTNPGLKQAWRIYDGRGRATADLVALEHERPDEQEQLCLRHPSDAGLQRQLTRSRLARIEPLLVDVWREGQRVGPRPTLEQMRERRRNDVEALDSGVRRLVNPHIYHVSLTQPLWELKQELLGRLRGGR
ncbi:nicotinate phosphoribosyltransferase [Candidatus Viridilinea mediisalina]|uniref:Nicotinate phosphoribosyltransferase n=1 Tax=Candidatus Viridilinea mediisalina TaxID=2024553 RepID=A0A2A6RDF6_9CHLR|nr:nicotinate phosphoribosyltransferase [Candidatus Viridilinea mediisalina]PDW00395.1 nicotinate phosphoribosyltransferase [Candidatus Viridilinea mediisalina]